MRAAVVDTNILVSGLMHPRSLPGQVLRDIEGLRLQPVVCEAVMAEYQAVLVRPRLRLPAADANILMALMRRMAWWVQVPSYTGKPALPDPADWPFIACALATKCPVITGNLRHFPAGVGVGIMTARDWVEGGNA